MWDKAAKEMKLSESFRGVLRDRTLILTTLCRGEGQIIHFFTDCIDHDEGAESVLER